MPLEVPCRRLQNARQPQAFPRACISRVHAIRRFTTNAISNGNLQRCVDTSASTHSLRKIGRASCREKVTNLAHPQSLELGKMRRTCIPCARETAREAFASRAILFISTDFAPNTA